MSDDYGSVFWDYAEAQLEHYSVSRGKTGVAKIKIEITVMDAYALGSLVGRLERAQQGQADWVQRQRTQSRPPQDCPPKPAHARPARRGGAPQIGRAQPALLTYRATTED